MALPAAVSTGLDSQEGTSVLRIEQYPGFDSWPLCMPPPLKISSTNINKNKRKRRPAGTPDPDAEVVALSPKSLMKSHRYVCEICDQGFQRDQNLQMHQRRHKIPWKPLERLNQEVRKRVYVCPDTKCLHNDPCHALGDLVGIKKHFRRKHSFEKQWKCEKCSKGYAVQSDFKAHIKTCGTRGHSCDCGRVFSRVESFIEHQENCTAKERINFGYNDFSSYELSDVGRKFHDQMWLEANQLELQLFPAKNKPHNVQKHSVWTNRGIAVRGDNMQLVINPMGDLTEPLEAQEDTSKAPSSIDLSIGLSLTMKNSKI